MCSKLAMGKLLQFVIYECIWSHIFEEELNKAFIPPIYKKGTIEWRKSIGRFLTPRFAKLYERVSLTHLAVCLDKNPLK